MRLDLTTLKLFLAAVEERSMARAAAREHITAPAISKRIAELEATLGVRLLERYSTGIRATAAGETLAAEVRSMIALLERTQVRMSEYARGIRGRVRLCSNPSGLTGSLTRDLRRYLNAYPEVDIDLHERRSVDVVRAVAEGEADIGIMAPQVPSEGLTVQPYHAVRLVVIAPQGHPLAVRKRISLSDAAGYDFVSLSEQSSIGALVNRFAGADGIALRHRLRVSTFDALRGMVQAGLGLGVLPEHCARPYAAAMGFACIALADRWAHYRLGICTRQEDTLSPSARLLVEQLVEAAA